MVKNTLGGFPPKGSNFLELVVFSGCSCRPVGGDDLSFSSLGQPEVASNQICVQN